MTRFALLAASIALLASGSAAAQDQMKINWNVRDAGSERPQIDMAVTDHPNFAMRRSEALSDYPEIAATLFTGAGEAPVRFQVRREAGTLDCHGTGGGGAGSGSCSFQSAPDLAAQLARRGVDAPKPMQALRMALSNVTLRYIDSIAEAGIRENNPDQLIRLRNHDITPRYIGVMRSAGVAHLDTTSIVRLHNHRIDSAFVASLRRAGLSDLQANGLIRMRRHGVDAAFVREVRAAGITNPGAEQLVQYRRRGYPKPSTD